MTTQEKYSKIMEVMSDKTLSEGCEVYIGKNVHFQEGIYRVVFRVGNTLSLSNGYFSVSLSMVKEIIGHPLRIGDAINWCEKNNWFSSTDSKKQIQELVKLMLVWKYKRKSLQPEDTELIDYIYSLII